MDVSKTKTLVQHVSLATLGGALLLSGNAAFAGGGHHHDGDKSYTLKGACAFLPAARATEFHGNPDRSKLNLGMAGNQWVVFDAAMRAFNLSLGNDPTQPAYRDNSSADATPAVWTLEALNDDANRYYIQLIPPGQIRKQIKSGCMTLGNDEDRNFLTGNIQVDFDVFASTNYKLMQDLANNGFIDEAVPYIANRLDLMVGVTNPKEIGATDYPELTDTAFEQQFDIAMDLLSGDIVASALDHINEGIHGASNGYMKKVDAYIRGHADAATMITMDYHFGDDTSPGSQTMSAEDWLDAALAAVATPAAGSPGENRLPGSGHALEGDSGENHTSHNLADIVVDGKKDCLQADGVSLKFCEFAVINKFNTHESHVHHVETPNGIVNDPAYVPVDVGFVWITELAYQLNNSNFAVQGMVGNQDIADLGIPNTSGVNADKVYSLALLATSENKKMGRKFIDFLRSPEGQAAYVQGGFTGLTDAQLLGGKCYAAPVAGVSVATNRSGDSCDDWLDNNNGRH